MEELTSTELAVRLHRSERTIQRWIQVGKLAATLLPDGRYAIDSDAIDAIMSPALPTSRSEEVGHRLDEISQRLDKLEHRIGNLYKGIRLILELLQQQRQPQAVQPPEIPIPTKQPISVPRETQAEASTLPEGAILLFQFARNHGVNESSIKNQARSKRFAYSERVKPNRPTEHDKFLMREQQRGVIAFWQRNGTPFTQCEQCPH